jgi:hypothetical protein
MEMNLEQLKKNFVTIKDIRNKVTNIFQILEEHLKKLKQTYAEFVVNNKQHLFVFGLDSFQFQSKLIDIEYEDMKRMFLAINNRMYCEYYKLYKIVIEYVKENITDKKTLELVKSLNTFPVYKDLEPYKQYNFEIIQELHEHIIILLYGINDFILNKENELQIHQKKQEIGLNINNFVTTFNFNILMVKEKGMLFISYIDFFHTLHTKYLQRFSMKMNLIYSQITHDIRFEDTPQTSELKKKELLNTFQDDNIDKSLIKQIKSSIDDSDSNDSDSPGRLEVIGQQINSPNKKNDEKEETSYNSQNSTKTSPGGKIKDASNILNEKNGLSGMLKKNIKKALNSGIGLFKNNKKIEGDNLSSSSNESISTNNAIEKNLELSLKKPTENLLLNISEATSKRHHTSLSSSNYNYNYNDNDNDNIISYNSEYSYSTNLDKNLSFVKPVSDEDEAELQRTLSSENIFMEISKQCLEITSPISETNKDFDKPIKTEVKEELITVIEEVAEVTEEDIEEVAEVNKVTEEVLEVTEVKEEILEETNVAINDDSDEKQEDNISVLTFDNFIDQKDDETSKDTDQKKKRQYKPRKKKNV